MDTETQIEEQREYSEWEAREDWRKGDYADYIDFIAECLGRAA